MTMMQIEQLNFRLNQRSMEPRSTIFLPSSELSELMSNAVCIRLVLDLGDVGVCAGGGVCGASFVAAGGPD